MISSLLVAPRASVSMALSVTLGATVGILLLLLLIAREIASAQGSRWAVLLGRVLPIIIIPLLLAFAFSQIMQIAQTW